MLSRSDKQGFSLIEVLISLAILALAVIVLLVERTRAFQQTMDTHHYRIAVMLSYEKMEELRAGIEEETEGTFEGREGYTWQVVQETVPMTIAEETQLEMTKWKLTVEYTTSKGRSQIVLESLSATVEEE